MTFGSWIVGGIGSIPTVFCFVWFAASVAFGWFAGAVTARPVVSAGLHPFNPSHFSAFSFIMSEFVTVKAVPFLVV